VELIYYNPPTTELTTIAIPATGGNIYFDPITQQIVGCDEVVTEVVIPEEINGLSVIGIADSAFADCELTKIEIPNSITKIGDNAFQFCEYLADVTIPDSVTYIGENAFSACLELKEVIIPDSVTYIGDYAFFYCLALEKATLPKNITILNKGVFRYCFKLKEITIPDSVTTICDSVFSCSGLQTIYMPKNLESIGEDVFSLSELSTVYCYKESYSDNTSLYPDGVTIKYIENTTNTTNTIPVTGGDIYFDPAIQQIIGCDTSVTSVVIPKEINGLAVTGIEDKAFMNCDSLTSIEIPDTITSIGNYAFMYCSALTDIEIPESVTSIEFCEFFGCTNLKNIKLPDRITYIGWNAFAYTGLTDITIPNSTTAVGNYAFNGCTALKSVTIPDSVIVIEDNAFTECTELETVYCYKNSVADNSKLYPSSVKLMYIDETFIYGDASGDGELTAEDAALVLQKSLDAAFVIGIEEKTTDYKKYIDVSGDGGITAEDAAQILQKSLDKTYKLGVES
jgi:hypothetical protein